MDIEVREYQEEDLEEVNQILMESFSYGKGKVQGEEFHELVAVVDQKIVGYLLLTKVLNPIKDQYYYWVDYVCVSSQYRGNGIGKKLLDMAYSIAKGEGAIYLQLTSSRFRTSAQKLYDKCGFMRRDSDIYRKEII